MKPFKYIVVASGDKWGPFDTPEAAVLWAENEEFLGPDADWCVEELYPVEDE